MQPSQLIDSVIMKNIRRLIIIFSITLIFLVLSPFSLNSNNIFERIDEFSFPSPTASAQVLSESELTEKSKNLVREIKIILSLVEANRLQIEIDLHLLQDINSKDFQAFLSSPENVGSKNYQYLSATIPDGFLVRLDESTSDVESSSTLASSDTYTYEKSEIEISEDRAFVHFRASNDKYFVPNEGFPSSKIFISLPKGFFDSNSSDTLSVEFVDLQLDYLSSVPSQLEKNKATWVELFNQSEPRLEIGFSKPLLFEEPSSPEESMNEAEKENEGFFQSTIKRFTDILRGRESYSKLFYIIESTSYQFSGLARVVPIIAAALFCNLYLFEKSQKWNIKKSMSDLVGRNFSILTALIIFSATLRFIALPRGRSFWLPFISIARIDPLWEKFIFILIVLVSFLIFFRLFILIEKKTSIRFPHWLSVGINYFSRLLLDASILLISANLLTLTFIYGAGFVWNYIIFDLGDGFVSLLQGLGLTIGLSHFAGTIVFIFMPFLSIFFMLSLSIKWIGNRLLNYLGIANLLSARRILLLFRILFCVLYTIHAISIHNPYGWDEDWGIVGFFAHVLEDISDHIHYFVRLWYYIPFVGVFLYLFHRSQNESQKTLKSDVLVALTGKFVFCVYVVGSNPILIPIPFLASLYLYPKFVLEDFRKRMFLEKISRKFEGRTLFLRRAFYASEDSQLLCLFKSIRNKFLIGDISSREYKSKRKELKATLVKEYLDSEVSLLDSGNAKMTIQDLHVNNQTDAEKWNDSKALLPHESNVKVTVQELCVNTQTDTERWGSGLKFSKCGFIIATFYAIFYIYGILDNSPIIFLSGGFGSKSTYEIFYFLIFRIGINTALFYLSWLVSAFFFGYFFIDIRGDSGLKKGIRIALVSIACNLPIWLLEMLFSAHYSRNEYLSSIILSLTQDLLFFTLLGILCFDWPLLKGSLRSKFNVDSFFLFEDIPSIATFVSTLLISFSTVVGAVVTDYFQSFFLDVLTQSQSSNEQPINSQLQGEPNQNENTQSEDEGNQ